MKPNLHEAFSFVAIEHEYKATGAVLDPRIVEAATKEHDTEGWAYAPSPVFAAIAEAGRILRKDPEAKLTNHEVPYCREIEHDIASCALVRIINASLANKTPAPPNASFTCEGAKSIDACSYAETSFASTIGAIATWASGGEHPMDNGYGCQIITDTEGPVFLRKGDGTPSSLTLTDIAINGIPYPAGSLVRTDLTQDQDRLLYGDTTGYSIVDEDAIEVVPVTDVTKVGFRRLSIFALPVQQRPAFRDCSREDFTRRNRQILLKKDVRQIRNIARSTAEKVARQHP